MERRNSYTVSIKSTELQLFHVINEVKLSFGNGIVQHYAVLVVHRSCWSSRSVVLYILYILYILLPPSALLTQ